MNKVSPDKLAGSAINCKINFNTVCRNNIACFFNKTKQKDWKIVTKIKKHVLRIKCFKNFS